MNKDVIYIEPEDDITDIIAKIEKSKEKIVALVPPKKAGVFRSIVNIKLIAKAGKTAEKSVVLVTVDPSITKLAAATKLPVAKNLQTAPVIPEVDTDVEDSDKKQTVEDVVEPEEDDKEAKNEAEVADNKEKSEKESAKSKASENDDDEENDEDNDEEEEEEKRPTKKKKKADKSGGNKFVAWIKAHKKLAICGGVIFVALIVFLVWAFAFAPAVDVSIAIKTESKNFSEGVTFTDKLSEENAKEGKFYLEEKKIENTQEVNFEATGQKNQGEKATGQLVVYAYFKERGNVPINNGTVFTYNGLNFVATEDISLSWSGDDDDEKKCDNAGQTSSLVRSGCQISGRVNVMAANAGTQYNVGASTSGWSTVINEIGVYSDKAMAGGTDNIKTVVQQSDIEKAKNELTTAKEDENKEKLYETIGDEYYIIEPSFEQSTSNAEATPAADQEVTGDAKPVLKATTTAKIYVVSKDKLKEFIKEKADLDDDQKVYDIKNIYIESFAFSNGTGSGRLKAKYYIGPKLTETEVVDRIKGKGLGDAQREIRDINGVSDVRIDKSYPWVMTVPGDSNKIMVSFEVKDQDGKEIKDQSKEDESKDEESTDENKDSKSDTKSDNEKKDK